MTGKGPMCGAAVALVVDGRPQKRWKIGDTIAAPWACQPQKNYQTSTKKLNEQAHLETPS